MTMPTLLKLETSEAIERWNKFAFANASELTIAHNPLLFNFYSEYLKLKPFYCILTKEKKDVGLLPLVLIGNKLVSVPHFSYGGILKTKSGITSGDEGELIIRIAESIKDAKADLGFYQIKLEQLKEKPDLINSQLEVRQFKPLFGNTISAKVNHFIPLKQNHDEQLSSFNANLRRKIGKAERNGIRVKIGGVKLVDDFSNVYNKNMHQLGSPTLGRDFFKSLCETLPANTEIAVAYLNGTPIGGGFCMWYDGYFENTWFSTLQEKNHLYTSYALHDKMVKSAIAKNAHTYSMGRSSRNSGVHKYKVQWPVVEKDLFFNSNLPKGVGLKDQKWMTKVWKLLPGKLVNSLGPYVAKRIY